MATWWVNQSQSYAAEREGGFLWAPLRTTNGRRLAHWDAMTLVRPADRVLHYADGAIRAVSLVTAAFRDAPKPGELPDAWDRDGRVVTVDMVDVTVPVRLAEIPEELRLAEPGGPFDVNGEVKQGYLFPLSAGFERDFVERFGARVPGLAPTPTQTPAVYRLNVAAAHLAGVLEHQAFSIAGSRAAMAPGDLLLIQLNLDDARNAGTADARIQHALVFASAEPDPTGALTRERWPDFDAGPNAHVLHASAVLAVEPFTFTVPPFSKDYWSPQNAVRLTDADAGIALERVRAAGVDPVVAPAVDEERLGLPSDPAIRAAVERHAVDEVLASLRARFPACAVVEMPHHNPGYDIEVLQGGVPLLYVEVKGTMRQDPVFLMSEVERAFSAANAARYELHVIYGIDLDAHTHHGAERRPGEVLRETHGLKELRWQGRLR